MRMQLRLGRNRAVLKNAVRLLIATGDVEILADAPRALGIYQLPVQFLVIDAADAARCRIEFDTIEGALGGRRGIAMSPWLCRIRCPEVVDYATHQLSI